MLILEAGNIKKYYSDRLILEFKELKVYSGDKIGIVGQNGSGKTTLMNILSGEIGPEEGYVRQYGNMAYIRQFSEEGIIADRKILKEFDLAGKTGQPVYSGGEETRIKIANAFSNENILLFADEPTANLDYKGIELLRQKLSQVETFMLISHDRLLLDSLCSKIIEVRGGRLEFFNGNYSSYKEQKQMDFERQEQEYETYISEKVHLEEAISDRKSKSKSIRKAPRRMGNSEARLHKRSANEKQEKINNSINSIRSRLQKLEKKEKPEELPAIKLDFSLTNPPDNKIVISAKDLDFSYGSKDIFRNTGFKVYNGLKTALWGENGSGKSTLLNLIFNKSSERIHIVPKATIGYFCQGFENLRYDMSVLENVMSASIQSRTVVRTILARLLITGDDVFKKVGCLSGGERIKVSFAKLFVSDANVLLLDEPTNYLDMASIEALEKVLKEYEGTVLFVSHDRAFVNSVADRLLIIEDHAITEFEGTIDEYRLSKGKSKAALASETEKTLLQMRIAEIVAKLDKPNSNKEALETEYQSILERLRNI